mgnify:FL=1
MHKLSDVSALAVRAILGNRNLTGKTSSANLAINAGGAATVKTNTALSFTIDGRMYYKAALSAQSIAVTHNWRGETSSGYIQPVSTTVYYVICLDASGNVKVVQGNYAGQKLSSDPTVGIGASVAGATWVGEGGVPDLPSLDYAPIGILKVATNGSTTFTAGTTLLDAAGVTVTYIDVSVLPATAP